ncbi:MAG TPA: Zn-ribbon domain-containing OB-fold protein [Actinomycetota bacterium]|nr:Zn-ribbon domain-containing OB-fold protein [Actinomycetota bacterium]
MRPPVPLTALSAAQLAGGVVAVEHHIRAEYAWDAGMAIGEFLHGLRQGRIMGTACRGCGRVLLPPRMFCEECFRPVDAFVELPATGTVRSFSVCSVAWDLRPLTEPELPAVIELAPGAALLHRLGGIAAGEARLGMPVAAVWRPRAERQGSVLDIVHWAPLGTVPAAGAR